MRRFGISEVLLATAAIAILIGVGRQNMTTEPVGTLAGVSIVIGLLVSQVRGVAVAMCLACVFGITMLGCGDAIRNPDTVWPVGLLMFVFSTCFAAIHGFAIRRPRSSNAAPRAT
jgi:hypothetical protein